MYLQTLVYVVPNECPTIVCLPLHVEVSKTFTNTPSCEAKPCLSRVLRSSICLFEGMRPECHVRQFSLQMKKVYMNVLTVVTVVGGLYIPTCHCGQAYPQSSVPSPPPIQTQLCGTPLLTSYQEMRKECILLRPLL